MLFEITSVAYTESTNSERSKCRTASGRSRAGNSSTSGSSTPKEPSVAAYAWLSKRCCQRKAMLSTTPATKLSGWFGTIAWRIATMATSGTAATAAVVTPRAANARARAPSPSRPPAARRHSCSRT